MRRSEGLKTWGKLLALRDEKIREQTVIKENGESILVEVVPSARELREACKLILAYCWGTPVMVGHDELERKVTELEEAIKAKSWVWDLNWPGSTNGGCMGIGLEIDLESSPRLWRRVRNRLLTVLHWKNWRPHRNVGPQSENILPA